MSAGNSIIGDCAKCCTCPTWTVEWDSRTASKAKCGTSVAGSCSSTDGNSPYLNRKNEIVGFCGAESFVTCEPIVTLCNRHLFWDTDWFDTESTDSSSCMVTTGTPFVAPVGSYVLSTLTDRYTTALLKSNTVAAFPAWDNDWNDSAGSFANLGTDERTYYARESRYRLRFKIPPTSVYRLTWVERFIGEAGTTIASVDVISRGVYRPTVTLSAPPTGGTQARAIAVMSSAGTISSIRITNPGSGYTSAPTVTVQAAINGGTSSTGWTATLTDGKVTAISGGSAGDYRPTLTFSAPVGTGTTAAATCTVDETGGIDAVSVTAAGSGYTAYPTLTGYIAEPTLTISSKVSVPTAAVLHLHLGTETSKCIAWDGAVPSGYDPDTPSTYPILPSSGYYEMAVPTSNGTTLVANVRAYCDNSSCP